MTFTNTWDETAPLGSALVSTVDDVIRALKLDLRERLAESSSDLNNGRLRFNPIAATTGTPTAFGIDGAAHTGLAATVEAIDVLIDLARTVSFLQGAITSQRAMRITAPTYAFDAAATITNAATLAISGAPVAGTNATITNTYSLWIEAGNAYLAGALTVDGALTVGGLVTHNAGESVKSTAVGTSPLTINHDPSGTITSRIVDIQEKDTSRFSFVSDEVTDGAPLDLDDFDNSSGVGRFIDLGRNSNASTPAPSFIKFTDKGGTARYIWFDSSGNLRQGTSAPTNTDTGGSALPVFHRSPLGGSTAQVDAGTFYASPNHSGAAVNDDTVGLLIPKAGTLRNFYTTTGSYATLTVMKNGVATDLVSVQGTDDTTHTVAVVAGDRISIRIVNSAGTVVPYWGLEYDAESEA